MQCNEEYMLNTMVVALPFMPIKLELTLKFHGICKIVNKNNYFNKKNKK